MHRKITKTGPATHTIALPAKWVKQNNLEAGQEIKLDEVENNLIISVQRNKNQQIKRVKYDTTLLQDMLEKLYRENTPQILIYSDEVIPKSINSIILKFPGLKIIEESKHKILLNQILEPSITQPTAMMRRIYLLYKKYFESNPGDLNDLEELLFLAGLQNKNNYEQQVLQSIFAVLKEINTPIFDDLYAYLRSIFDHICIQKYSFTKQNELELQKLFSQDENLFKTYYEKEDSLIVGKIYYCFKQLKLLNKIIISNQSLEKLEATENQSKKKYLVGVCLKNNANEFWRDYVQGSMIETQKKYSNIDFIYKSPFTYPDIEAQEKIIDEYIEQGVDLIILAPNHPTKLNRSIEKIRSSGIQLVIIDTVIESKVKHTYIGWNNYVGGVLTAKHLQKILKPKSKILVIEGQTEGNFHERVSGFQNTLRTHSIKVISAEFQQSLAYKKTLELLQKESFDAIYATSDNMALGVLQALSELNINIPVCGFDATNQARELVKKGKLVCTIDDKPHLLGSLAIETANKMLLNRQVSEKITYDVELVAKK